MIYEFLGWIGFYGVLTMVICGTVVDREKLRSNDKEIVAREVKATFMAAGIISFFATLLAIGISHFITHLIS